MLRICLVFILITSANASVSVLDYGAAGDGILDDTAAFQNALNTGEDVLLPAGSYRISSVIISKDDQKIFGDNAVIISETKELSNNLLDCIQVVSDGVSISNLAFEGTDSTPSSSPSDLSVLPEIIVFF